MIFTFTLLISMYIVPVNAVGTTYYVSNTYGLDTNNGLSPSTPFKSFTNIKPIRLGPGDRVLLRRGDVWNERLNIFANGTSAAWVYVGPYGNLSEAAPTITLGNSRDDICIVAQDLYYNGTVINNTLNYLHIDNINMTNSRVGVYFRYLISTQNAGAKVTNCTFTNMVQDSVMNSITTASNIPIELAMAKGNLDNFTTGYSPTGGGGDEYLWPSAVTIGGRSAQVNANSPATFTKVSEVVIKNSMMNNCVDGLNAIFYLCQSSPAQGGAFKGLIKNIKMQGCTLTGSVNGIFAIDGATGGYDGTPTSVYGIFKNNRMLAGHPTYRVANGHTGAIFNNSTNFYVVDSEFSGQTNNTMPDGCGLDFESNTESITIEKSIFNANKGQAVLMMDGGNSGYIHKNITFLNNLFYNNMQGVSQSTAKYDILIYNNGNQAIQLTNNRFVSKVKTAGAYINTIGTVGAVITGVTQTNSSTRRNNTLTDYQTEVNTRGLTAAQTATTVYQITNGPDVVSPLGINNDLFIQNGSFSLANGIVYGAGALAWVPDGFYATYPVSMPKAVDVSYDMFVADSDEHSGMYINSQVASSSYGDNSGFLYYANKWGVFVYSSTRGQLGVVARANITTYNLNQWNSFRINQKLDGSADFYVNGQLVLTIANAAPAQTNGGFLGFNSTSGAGYTAYFQNIKATV